MKYIRYEYILKDSKGRPYTCDYTLKEGCPNAEKVQKLLNSKVAEVFEYECCYDIDLARSVLRKGY